MEGRHHFDDPATPTGTGGEHEGSHVAMPDEELRLGSWARVGERVGVVARLDGDEVTVFSPGDRQIATAARSEVELVPAGAVRVQATVDLPLAHGMGEDVIRRWFAVLLDETLRERAYAALREAGLDEAAALPGVSVTVSAAPGEGALCLCGAVTPADTGEQVPCATCGRRAAAPPIPPTPGATQGDVS